jgi:hypothetical protein
MKTLAKEHGYFNASRTGGPFVGVWTVEDATNGWTQGIGPENTDYFSSATYFDLAGMSMEEKTIFLEAATVQQAGTLLVTGATGDSLVIWDIMTSIPVDITNPDLQEDIVRRGLGFSGSTLNFEHVLYQRMTRYGVDLDFGGGFPVISEQHQSGSLSPTASDRIYSYRLLAVASTLDTTVILPPVRHLISVNPKEEPTFEHIMRLKRSYDLQQSYDED